MFDYQDVLDAQAQSSSSSCPEPPVESTEKPSPTYSQNQSTDIAVQMSEPRLNSLSHSMSLPLDHLELPQPQPAHGIQPSQSQTVLTRVGTEYTQTSPFNDVIPSAQVPSEFQQPPQLSLGLQDGPSQTCGQTLSTNVENNFLQIAGEQYGVRFDGVIGHQPHSSEFSGFFEFPHLQPPVGLLISPTQSCSQTVLTDIGSTSIQTSEKPHLAGFNGLIDSRPLPFEFPPHQPALGLRESPLQSYGETKPTDVGNEFPEQYRARLDGVVDHEFLHPQQPVRIFRDPVQSCSQTVLPDVGSTSVQMSQSQPVADNGLNPSSPQPFDYNFDDVLDSGTYIFYFND